MKNHIKILGFGGSLRKGSFNQSLLETGFILKEACTLGPAEGMIEVFDKIRQFPLYNQDEEAQMPVDVKEFEIKIREDDEILIVTPEYNYAIPVELNNS